MRQPSPWRRGGAAWYAQIDRRTTWLAPKDATKAEAQASLYRLLADRSVKAKARANPTTSDIFNLYLACCDAEFARGERERRITSQTKNGS